MGIENLDKSKELYSTVTANTESKDEQTIPNGKVWILSKLWGNAVYNNNVKVQISFDTCILGVTHGDFIKDCSYELTGDGSKKLTILLKNDSATDETIGGGYIARKKIE